MKLMTYSTVVIVVCMLVCVDVVLNVTPSSSGGSVLMSSIPLPGHINPLIAIASELIIYRNYHVEFAVVSSVYQYVKDEFRKHGILSQNTDHKNHMNTNVKRVNIIELQGCPLNYSTHTLYAAVERSVKMHDFTQSMSDIANWVIDHYECMYESMHTYLHEQSMKDNLPDIFLFDAASLPLYDVSNEFIIPTKILNCPSVLTFHSSYILPPNDSVSPFLSGLSSKHPIMRYGNAIIPRMLFPMLRMAVHTYIRLTLGVKLNGKRRKYGLSAVNILSLPSSYDIIQDMSFGIEYYITIPDHIHMVGALIGREMNETAKLLPLLSRSEIEWMDSNTSPIIYISMGTIVRDDLDEHEQNAINSVIESAIQQLRVRDNCAVRILWRTLSRPVNTPDDSSSKDCLYITPYVTSQLAVLSHPRTTVFISHCGINSVNEAVYFNVSLICIPAFADQLDMAVRADDANIGIHLPRSTLTAEQLTSAVNFLVFDPNGERVLGNITSVRSELLSAGGVIRAADIIQELHTTRRSRWRQHNHLPHRSSSYSSASHVVLMLYEWLLAHDVDIYLSLALVSYGVYRMTCSLLLRVCGWKSMNMKLKVT